MSAQPATGTSLTVTGIISGSSKGGNGRADRPSSPPPSTGVTSVTSGTLLLSGSRTAQATGGFSVGNVATTTGTLNVSNGTFTVGTSGSNFLVGAGRAASASSTSREAT